MQFPILRSHVLGGGFGRQAKLSERWQKLRSKKVNDEEFVQLVVPLQIVHDISLKTTCPLNQLCCETSCCLKQMYINFACTLCR